MGDHVVILHFDFEFSFAGSTLTLQLYLKACASVTLLHSVPTISLSFTSLDIQDFIAIG